jgi:hypothetical protein
VPSKGVAFLLVGRRYSRSADDKAALKRLVDLPMAWPDQWRTLGLQAPALA